MGGYSADAAGISVKLDFLLLASTPVAGDLCLFGQSDFPEELLRLCLCHREEGNCPLTELCEYEADSSNRFVSLPERAGNSPFFFIKFSPALTINS
jgi:hypothetical protein